MGKLYLYLFTASLNHRFETTVDRAFRDASAGPSTYSLTLVDVLHAVAKASYHRLLDFAAFNADEYEHYERIENGDLNWIVPAKIVAFASPNAASRVVNGYPQHSPEAYLPYFRSETHANTRETPSADRWP